MPNWDKRAENREYSKELLYKANIQFREFNNGAHLKIGQVDFWPGTGLWKDQQNNKSDRGVHKLIEHLKTIKTAEPRKLKITVSDN